MEDMETSESSESTATAGSSDPLLKEFTCWQVEPGCSTEKVIRLDRISRNEEGQATIFLRIDQNCAFKLHCPPSYPNHQDENFLVEAEPPLQLWCNAVNEFILDSKDSLSLSTVLNKSLSLYSAEDSRARTEGEENEESGEDDLYESESEDSEAEDRQLDDMLDQDFNWELEVGRRKKRWTQKEIELRTERSEKTVQQTSSRQFQETYYDHVLKPSQPQQVFTSKGASGILINDLVRIMACRGEDGLEADSIDDNIFQWNVKLRNFTNDLLCSDLQKMEQEFGYDYIELQMDFSMDLYPFFPPLVKVVRPRLQGSMMLRVTSMEILKLTYWDPARDMMSVLKDIRNFLSTWARVDTKSERNDRARYPSGSYLDIEHHLLRLALVSEVSPRANAKYISQIPSPAKPPSSVKLPPTPPPSTKDEKTEDLDDKNEKMALISMLPFFNLSKGEKKKKKGDAATKQMAKGVGYSTMCNKGWDVKSYTAAQEEKDKQIELVLDKILVQLKQLQSTPIGLPRQCMADSAASGSTATGLPPVDTTGAAGSSNRSNSTRRKRKHSPDEAGSGQEELSEDCAINPLTDMYTVLEGSALVPFIETKLQHNTFMEIGKHPAVYMSLVGIIRELCNHTSLLSLLGPLPDQNTSIQAILANLEPQAAIMINRIGKASANGSVPKEKGGKAASKKEEKTTGGDTLAKQFQMLSEEVRSALAVAGFLNKSKAICVVNGEHSSPHVTNKERKEEEENELKEYMSALAPIQFATKTFPESGKFAHYYNSEYINGDAPSYQVVCRVAQDIASLMAKDSLPLNPSSSIFVRSDDDKSTLLKAVITGPEGTPYTGGIYEFDIYFPKKYPADPPKVNFRTTGAGTVRFNPNLYHDGKVCLSLLGTWEGAAGEQWNKDTSTILQVLISIQSLILCPEPYYNEPGFERQYGTDVGNSESKRYSEDVLKNNLKFAILESLECPPLGFEEVVKAHFYLKRAKLIQELEQLSLDCGNSVKRLVTEVSSVLNNLPRPASLSA